jgi:ADP-ribosyl-[dinitrogen reductase] hydrolase
MSDTPTLERLFDRALGAYLGFAIGDALGATVEFMRPREIAAQYGLHRDIIGGGWLKLARGQVTDDTTMSLALGQALIESGPRALQQFVEQGQPDALRHIADAFVAWLRGKPVDCGNTCRRGIQRYMLDGSLAGPPSDGDAGNGAVMRNLPVALATLHWPAGCHILSLAQARLTHHHPLSDQAVLGLGELLQVLLRGAEPAACQHWAQVWTHAHPAFAYQPYRGRASAYVVDTVQTVLHHLTQHEGFEDAVVATVNQGDDADTTGALVGMLAGARCGAAALPSRWLRQLQPSVLRAVTDQTSHLLALASELEALGAAHA